MNKDMYNSNEFIDLVGMMYRLELLTKFKYISMLMNSVNYRRGFSINRRDS